MPSPEIAQNRSAAGCAVSITAEAERPRTEQEELIDPSSRQGFLCSSPHPPDARDQTAFGMQVEARHGIFLLGAGVASGDRGLLPRACRGSRRGTRFNLPGLGRRNEQHEARQGALEQKQVGDVKPDNDHEKIR